MNTEFLPAFVEDALEENRALVPALQRGRASVGQVLAFCHNFRIAGIGNLETASPGKPFQGDILCDLNGENWRARELGSAWVRARGQLGEDVRIIAPAESLGETGAASGAVGVCVAVRSLSRRYSRTGQVVLLSSAEPGQVGAMVLGRVDKA